MKLFGLMLGRHNWEVPAVHTLSYTDHHRTNPLYESPSSTPRQRPYLTGSGDTFGSVRSDLQPIPEDRRAEESILSLNKLRPALLELQKNSLQRGGGSPRVGLLVKKFDKGEQQTPEKVPDDSGDKHNTEVKKPPSPEPPPSTSLEEVVSLVPSGETRSTDSVRLLPSDHSKRPASSGSKERLYRAHRTPSSSSTSRKYNRHIENKQHHPKEPADFLEGRHSPTVNQASLSKSSRYKIRSRSLEKEGYNLASNENKRIQIKSKGKVGKHIHSTIESIFGKQNYTLRAGDLAAENKISSTSKPDKPDAETIKASNVKENGIIPGQESPSIGSNSDLYKPSTSKENLLYNSSTSNKEAKKGSTKNKKKSDESNQSLTTDSYNSKPQNRTSSKNSLPKTNSQKETKPSAKDSEQTETMVEHLGTTPKAALAQNNVRRIAAAIESRNHHNPRVLSQNGSVGGGSNGVTRTDSAESTEEDSRSHSPRNRRKNSQSSKQNGADVTPGILHSEDSGITRGDQASTDSHISDPSSERIRKPPQPTIPPPPPPPPPPLPLFQPPQSTRPEVRDAAVSAKPAKERRKVSSRRSFCKKCGHARKQRPTNRGNSFAWNTEDYYKSIQRDDPRFLEATGRLARYPSAEALPPPQGYFTRRWSVRSSSESRRSFPRRVPSLPCMCEQCLTHPTDLYMHRPIPYPPDFYDEALRGGGPQCTCHLNYFYHRRPSFSRKVQFRDKSNLANPNPLTASNPTLNHKEGIDTVEEQDSEELKEVEQHSNAIFDPEKKFSPSASPNFDPPTILKKTNHPILTEDYIIRNFKNGSLKMPVDEMYKGQPWMVDDWRRYIHRANLRKRRRRAFYMGVMALSLVIFVGVVVSVLLIVLRKRNNVT